MNTFLTRKTTTETTINNDIYLHSQQLLTITNTMHTNFIKLHAHL